MTLPLKNGTSKYYRQIIRNNYKQQAWRKETVSLYIDQAQDNDVNLSAGTKSVARFPHHLF
ncbi:MAG: hypothetical protein AAAB11_11010 [Rhizobium giardinii]|jgi:hypothetical protein